MEEEILDGVKTDFCIGVAGYPEKHYEAPNLDTDIAHLKNKIDLGAGYVTTQMFFDNQRYYDYISKCRERGINVPILPGLKPLTTKKQLSGIPRVFNVDIPVELYSEMMKCKTDEATEQVGAEWLLHQCRDLLKNGCPVLHFYTLSKPNIIYNVLKQLF